MKTRKPKRPSTFLVPGDRARYTGVFLRNTGLMVGSEGEHIFTVVRCKCELCVGSPETYVAVMIPKTEEVRHVARVNLFRWAGNGKSTELTLRNLP